MAKQPYTAAEKARIVAKGEARLGAQHFIGLTEIIPATQVLETLEKKVEDAESKFHAMYVDLFAKAVANLKSSQDLRRI
jgi:hypothetical protein